MLFFKQLFSLICVLKHRGQLDRDEFISLLNTKLASCERFSSRIEISSNGQDAHFINLASSSSSSSSLSNTTSSGGEEEPRMKYDVSDHVKPLYVNKMDGKVPTEAENYEGLRSFLAHIVWIDTHIYTYIVHLFQF